VVSDGVSLQADPHPMGPSRYVGRMASYPFRTALVTGASAGIGEAIVRRLAADGVKTIVVARRADRLESLVKELSGVEALVGDVANSADLDRIAARLTDVDLLVNNAGLGVHCKAAEAPAHHFDNQVAVNIGAVVELSRAAAVAMSTRRRGWILNVSSVAGGISTPDNAAAWLHPHRVSRRLGQPRIRNRSAGLDVANLSPSGRNGIGRCRRRSRPQHPRYPQQSSRRPHALPAAGRRERGGKSHPLAFSGNR
jgi:NADP-dependent 3-hydroxy acid dehydrogenase YdfG